ncbi:hypothetical protein F2Q65_11340 [Thiohalocapsa marina]|uniref:Uncharacterized protein n=1 Tax=Thiohalocapsa marina TaxID=424902 RepID=A0A5M8FNH7_9GAMM|nr:hypothetical protein [Thiohalocapsa marina]KAA6184691.1 hypothetical protein F2Q65_11340 [Thiohalocapsa marina]
MKLCPGCDTSPLPFVMVTLIAGIVGFITWLILGLSDLEPLLRLATAVAAFLAIGATLLHYVISCLRRHCQHRQRFERGLSSR